MSFITVIIIIFSVLGALDRIFGNRFGLGKEFERGFELFSAMALTMIGLIVIAPALGSWLKPVFEGFYTLLHIDPSVIPALLFANDMGGAALSTEIAKDALIGGYNAYVVSSMMGCVISFTIPFASGLVSPEQHREMFFGFLCGIITIPAGCLVAGFMCGIGFSQLVLTLLPLLIICAVIALGMWLVPNTCVNIFKVFGVIIKAFATVGLSLGIISFLTEKTIIVEFATLEEGARICVNACVTLSGAFPLMFVVGKLLKKPMAKLGGVLGVNSTSALAFVPTLVTNATTFGMMRDMDKKGVVLNSAFAVSAAFVFGCHLGFTMGLDKFFVAPMIVGKLISGISAVILAMLIYKPEKTEEKVNAPMENAEQA